MSARFISEEQIQFLKENYLSYSNKQLGEIFNWTRGQVEHYLSCFNLKRDDIGKFRRKYTVNEYFFHTFTPESAYILGFVTGDGYIDYKSYYLSIYLSKKDLQILQDIKNVMNSTSPIKIKVDYSQKNYGKEYCKLNINSKIIFDQLNLLGVTRRKTGHEIYPNMPDKFKYDYLHGLFDADGTITMTKNNIAKQLAIYSSSLSYLESIKNIFNIGNIYTCKGKCYGLFIQNRADLIKIFNNFYKTDRTLYLNRKHLKFIQVLDSYQTKMV